MNTNDRKHEDDDMKYLIDCPIIRECEYKFTDDCLVCEFNKNKEDENKNMEKL